MQLLSSRSRFAAVCGALAIVASLSASAASASDTFFLENQSKSALLDGTSLWGKGNTMNSKCRTGPFPGPTETGFTFQPGDKGSITLSQDPFSSCLPGVNPLIDNVIQGPGITNGAWVWIPVDPFIGDSHLTCEVQAFEGSNPVTTSVDGLTCTFSDVGSTTVGAFTSSAAALRNGKAVIQMQHFRAGGKEAKRAKKDRGRYEVTLTTKKGRVLGSTKVTVVEGKARTVAVPVPKALRKEAKNEGSAKVRATIERIDGERGKGDRAKLIVLEDSPDIPF